MVHSGAICVVWSVDRCSLLAVGCQPTPSDCTLHDANGPCVYGLVGVIFVWLSLNVASPAHRYEIVR